MRLSSLSPKRFDGTRSNIQTNDRGAHGYRLHRRDRLVFCPDMGHGKRLRQTGRAQMTLFYLIGALASGALLAYLLYAMFNAEDL
jgi:hypothetical protein